MKKCDPGACESCEASGRGVSLPVGHENGGPTSYNTPPKPLAMIQLYLALGGTVNPVEPGDIW